jgi:ABC-type transport system involved in multi-copper enzyme maturation permease subunit
MNERATVLGSSPAISGGVGRWRSPSMVWRVARKEFTEITRDGRFLWNCLIILALLLTAIGVGASRYEDDRALREAASLEVREQWLKQGDKGPHTAGHYGVYAFKPATPLALFDPGINDYVGTIQYLEAHKENQASYKPAADSNALQRFGELSGAMVMQVLVPLLVILLCFSMISGEREDGTLRQLMSIGATPAALVWGKASGVGLVLGVVLLPAVIAGGLIASQLISDVDPHDLIDFPGKLVVLALAYGLFFAAFAFVSLAVSIKARSSRAALTVLIGFWIVAGLLLPRVAADVGRTRPPRSRRRSSAGATPVRTRTSRTILITSPFGKRFSRSTACRASRSCRSASTGLRCRWTRRSASRCSTRPTAACAGSTSSRTPFSICSGSPHRSSPSARCRPRSPARTWTSPMTSRRRERPIGATW